MISFLSVIIRALATQQAKKKAILNEYELVTKYLFSLLLLRLKRDFQLESHLPGPVG